MIQVKHFLVVTWLLGLFEPPGIHSYKLSEPPPINITNSRDPTVVHDAGEMNTMPEPQEGVLKFLLDKVARLETELKAAHTEIDTMKEHVGLDSQHVAMPRRGSRDPHAGTDVLKKVLGKHHHQRETGNYDPQNHKDPVADASEALLAREDETSESDETGIIPGIPNGLNPSNAIPFNLGCSVTEPDAWVEGRTLNISFGGFNCWLSVAGTRKTIDLRFGSRKVELPPPPPLLPELQRAVSMMRDLRRADGCNRDDIFHCMAKKVADRLFAPPMTFLPDTLKAVVNTGPAYFQNAMNMMADLLIPTDADCDLGNTFDCMAEKVADRLFAQPLTFLPDQLKAVVNAGPASVQRVLSMMTDLLNTPNCDKANTFECMAQHVFHWMPPQLRTVVNAGQEGVDRVFAMIRDLLNTANCDRGNTFECMAQHVFHWLPQQLHTVVNAGQEGVDRVFAMIRDLLNTAGCNRGNTFECMAKRVAGYVRQFEPPVPVPDHLMNFLPHQLHTVVNAGQEGVDRVFAMIRDLLNTPGCDRGNTFECMAKRVAGDVMKFEPPVNFMPSPVGVLAGSNVNSVKSLMAMGDDLMHCQNFESGHEVMKCLGFKIIERVPPLSYLNQLGDLIAETLDTFAKVATSLAMKALGGGTSLIEKASVSQFPPVGKMPVRHERGNLVVEMHSQEMHPSLLQLAAAEREQQDSEVPELELQDGGDVHVTDLITQFNGKEVDSGSCLAFAPRNKNGAHVGNHQEATKDDWTSAKKEDFVQLEPWAVPCDNTWMKENWNKWQGFSFYTAKTAVEKCLTVKFSVSLQPVLAFIGGLSFDILPDELFELVTTVCWPNQMPGGLDLSVLRSEIKTSGHLLFSRTLRLAKRFGKDTDFVKKNLDSSYKTWRSSIGIAEGESGFAFAPMSLLGGNRSDQVQGDGQETEYWIDPEELYLSSIDYGDSMEPNRTWELRGEDAMLRLSKLQEAKKTGETEEVVELFSFKKPGNVSSFHVRGLLDGNILELGVQMGYGPYQSPSRRIPLADIGAQFAVVLAAIPWISVETKKTAVAALKDFWPGQEELEGPQPADKSSMVAWFQSEDASTDWKSSVGSWQGRVTRGSVTRKVEAGHGAKFPVAYLAGDPHAGYDFGQIMKQDYTICSVTRYIEGGLRKRILQHNQPNWLHGHWEGKVGVTFYNYQWVNQDGLLTGLTDWLVLCGNSAGVVLRGQERKNLGQHAAGEGSPDAHLYINDGHFTESSDFGVMEIIVWNRALSEQEMWTSMEYLNWKLSGL